jgi:hypothetical protein
VQQTNHPKLSATPACEAGISRLIALLASTPSVRLLADKSAEALAGIAQVLSGLAVLVADPARLCDAWLGIVRLRVSDWLPALVNAGRAFVTIGAVALF